ncbi:MAG TPA: hypothetical protein VE547_14075, partial [Mycobacteriales bacterium]|nr:hypothetical protein [Mycobacteriales bacterium]
MIRLEVRYDDPVRQEYRDLWVLHFAADGWVDDVEEWGYWPGRAAPPAPDGPAARRRPASGRDRATAAQSPAPGGDRSLAALTAPDQVTSRSCRTPASEA